MKEIRVVSRKYNGELRDEYTAFLYAEEPELFVVYAPPDTRYFHARRDAWFPPPDGLLELYFKARWYVVWHICEQHSGQNLIYAHISTPAVLTGDMLHWVDLDLDYRVHLDGSIELVDEQDFDQNSHMMGYPPQVIASARAACVEIERLYRNRTFPFNHQEQVTLYQNIKQELDV